MRKLGIIVAIILGLLVVLIVAIPLVVDVNRYHGLVQSQIEKALARPVTFGTMHLSLTPPSVRLDNVMVAEDPRFGTAAFASAHTVDAAIQLWPLLRGNVEVNSLTLDQPRVQLIRSASGVWNFSTLGRKKESAAASEGELSLDRMSIQGGQVTVTDQSPRSRAVYDNVDITLRDYAPRKAFRLEAALHLPGSGKQALELEGTAGPLADAMSATPFDGKLQFNEVSISGLHRLTSLSALEGMDGILTGTLSVSNRNGVLNSEGSLKLVDAVIKKNSVDYPITLDYKVTDEADRVHIDKAKLHLGTTPIVIAGDINAAPTPAQLDLRVSLKETSIEEVARLASAFGVAFNPTMKVGGNVTADLRAVGAATAPAMTGSISARNVRISGGDLKQPVEVGAMSLELTPQQVRSAPFTATSGGTRVAVEFTLTNYTSSSPVIDATVRTGSAKVAEVLSIASAYGVDAARGVEGTGDISLDLRARGPAKNASELNFSGSGKLANATLKTPDLTQPLAVKNADLRFSSNSMTLQNLSASLGQTNATGNMTLQNFAAPRVQFTLNADKVNVAELQQITTPAPAQRASTASLVPSGYAQRAQPSIVEKMTGGGAITIGTVVYDQLLLQDLKATAALDRGVVRLSPLTANAYGGQQSGSVILDLRQTPMAVTITSKLDQVDANKLLSSVSSVKDTLYGLLAANGNTSFRAADSAEMARTLNGTLNLDLTKGRLAHVDLLNQLAGIARFLNVAPQATSQPFTDILRLTGTFDVVNGLAKTNNLKALIPGGSLAADGAINLADQGLNMHVTAVLTKELTQQVGGTQVGGFMNTALANSNGELVIPVLVTGTMSSPRFAPDLAKVAQMKLQQMLPTAANPGGAVSGILGAVLGGKNEQGQQGKGGLSGILGTLSGQQQQQKSPPQSDQPNANQQQQPQGQAQPQQPNPLGDLLNTIVQQQQKKKQQQEQQKKEPPPPPPK